MEQKEYKARKEKLVNKDPKGSKEKLVLPVQMDKMVLMEWMGKMGWMLTNHALLN